MRDTYRHVESLLHIFMADQLHVSILVIMNLEKEEVQNVFILNPFPPELKLASAGNGGGGTNLYFHDPH